MVILNYTGLGAILAALVAFLITILAVVSATLIRRLFSDASLPANLPWVGMEQGTGLLARATANLSSITNLKVLLDEGYNKYSKHGQTYVLPYFLNGPQVILPTSQIRWLLEQPYSVLSQDMVNRQFLEAKYTFLHATLVDDPVHPEIVQHQLTKKINTFADDIVEEVNLCLEETWGVDTEEWREVKIYDTMLTVVTRLSTRVFMGLPLCRNVKFLEACSSFIRNVVLVAAAISLFPSFLKPIVAPVFTLYDYVKYLQCRKFLLPIIRERLSQLKNSQANLPLVDSKHPNDYIQWAIDHAVAKQVVNAMELDPRVIACRFSVLSFAAIQSSVITLTNALFDLASSPECASTLATMRDEALRETMPEQTKTRDAAWSKTSLARMTHVDSALRESLRLNGFIERGIMKMVVARGGVTLPDGSHIPYGTKVGVSGYSVHHDEAVYADAARYDAFRFVGPPADGNRRPRALVNTSEKFMGFSHGSHACPGRFFAANQLKIALAHIALLYEIEPIPRRPVNRWFFGHIAPPMSETLRVRRRKL
ncbi:cytochrome P450 [Xylariaceae sp. FL0662B]|nr:cytochrome P450 [Xylariaceae sp. FL0662B]